MDAARPDPVDGLHLALLQKRRDQLAARAAGRSLGVNEWLMVAMALVGIGMLASATLRRAERLQSVLVGTVLIVQAVALWLLARNAARAQLRQVENQIAAEGRREDAATVAEAASAARELLL
jgi:hypothetical protein